MTDDQKKIFERILQNQQNQTEINGDLKELGQLLIPVFRQAFPQMVAQNIVGVQPLGESMEERIERERVKTENAKRMKIWKGMKHE